MSIPGLTCARCGGDLYPHQARRTDDGWTHTRPCPRYCDVDGCGAKHTARGYCLRHYDMWKRHGTPTPDEDEKPRPGRAVDTTGRLEDLEWMAETGESLEGAAARIGITADSVTTFLKRQGRHDIAAVLRSRDPAPIEDEDAKARRVAAWHESRKQRAA